MNKPCHVIGSRVLYGSTWKCGTCGATGPVVDGYMVDGGKVIDRDFSEIERRAFAHALVTPRTVFFGTPIARNHFGTRYTRCATEWLKFALDPADTGSAMMTAEEIVRVLRRVEPSTKIRALIDLLQIDPTADEIAEAVEFLREQRLIRE